MLKKKIASAVAALAMAATMSVSALSASAACVHNGSDCIGNAQFWAFYDSDNDGDEEWAPAPHGMDDGNIASVTYINDSLYQVTLQSMSYGILTGSITAITDEDDNPVTITNNQVNLVPNAFYNITVTVGNFIQHNMEVQFVISPCSTSGCDCGCN